MVSQEGGSEVGTWFIPGPQEGLGLCNNEHSVEYSCFPLLNFSLMFYKKDSVFSVVFGDHRCAAPFRGE